MLSIISKFFGHLISKKIFYSQAFTAERKQAILQNAQAVYDQKHAQNNSLVRHNFSIPSSGSARIDITEYQYPSRSQSSQEQAQAQAQEQAQGQSELAELKIIINAFGRKDCYERHTEDLINQAEYYQYHNIKIVGFNFRNIMNSSGKVYTQQDWIDDVIAVTDYYLARGVKYENILLSGHSMGAAFVTIAAAQIYQRENKQASVKIINDRSFKNLPAISVPLVFGNLGSGVFVGSILAVLSLLACIPFGLFGVFGVMIAAAVFATTVVASKLTPRPVLIACEIIANIILSLSFGRLNAAHAYRELPEDSKRYVFVKKDPVIHKGVGLAHDTVIKSERREVKQAQAQTQIQDRTYYKLKDNSRSETTKVCSVHDLPLYGLKTTIDETVIDGKDVSSSMIHALLRLA